MNSDHISSVLALDIGTSSVRAILFDARGQKIGDASQIAYAQSTTPDGGIETDADTLLERLAQCIDALLKTNARPIAVACSCFWHSLMAVDARGNALSPLFSWADNRAAPQVAVLRATLDEDETHARTGAVFHPSYWPAKLLWLHRTKPELFASSTRWIGFGEYLALKWCDLKAPKTSLSMASGSGIFNQKTCDWDNETLKALPVARENLPILCDADEELGKLRTEMTERWPQLVSAQWFPALGDGACSNMGSGCTTPEKIALNVGTSGALRVVLENYEAAAPVGLWRYRVDCKRVLLGGALSNGGNLFAWARQTFNLPDDAETQISTLKADAHGLTVLPFLAGERSPLWNADARFALEGASLDTTPTEILRACLEASALRFQAVAQLLFAAIENNATNANAADAKSANTETQIQSLSSTRLSNRGDSFDAKSLQIVASGGALVHSPAWTQIMCDCLGASFSLSPQAEASARGAALMALESLGIVADASRIFAEEGQVVLPNPENHAIYRRALERQNALYRKLSGNFDG